MAEENVSRDFNLSSLMALVDDHMNHVMEEFKAYPNNLFIRCIQYQMTKGLNLATKPQILLTSAENSFLEKNYIAETYYNGNISSNYYLVSRFLPPWAGMINALAERMLQFKPGEEKPGLVP